VTSAQSDWREFTFTTHDGLELFARTRGPLDSRATPLLCLPGLTRNSRDFEPLADAMIGEPRLFATFDYRGRGRSQYAEPSTYTPHHELTDAIALMDRLGLNQVCVIGTSRGGIIAMLMAAVHSPRIAGAVLNDIGPRLEPEGLLRIVKLLSQPARFGSWAEAISSLRSNNPGMEGLTDEAWGAFALRIFREEHGLIRPDCDPRLADHFPTAEEIRAGKVKDLWELFAAMKNRPCAVLRGENSDLLSAATVEKMKLVHGGLKAVTVRGRGHVPFLDEPESLEAIRDIAAQCDSG
jgi:pimeloyl-ACP methyl ester carboxylesterase